MPDLVLVPGPDLERVRPLVCQHIERMAEGSRGRFTCDDIWAAIVTGRMQLWLAIDGADVLAAGTSEIVAYPRCKAFRWVGVSGRAAKAWLPALPTAEAWARAQGCTETQALVGQRGLTRLLRPHGFTEEHILISKAL